MNNMNNNILFLTIPYRFEDYFIFISLLYQFTIFVNSSPFSFIKIKYGEEGEYKLLIMEYMFFKYDIDNMEMIYIFSKYYLHIFKIIFEINLYY